MQNEKENIDILMKSLLADAEEEVPSRVWDAVSSSLEKHQLGPVVLWWRRAAVGIAAAAAVALGVFFTQRFNSNLINHNDAVAVKPQQPQTSSDNNRPAETSGQVPTGAPEIQELAEGAKGLVADAGNIVRQNPVAKHIVIEEPERTELPELSVPEHSIQVQEPIEYSQAVEVAEEASEPVDIEEDVISASIPLDEDAANEDAAAALARQEWEDVQSEKPSGISLSIGGDVQNNGNPRAATGMSMKHAPGYTAPTATTVEQVSKESAYSVPMSVGLGVRIPFAKRWSVGTGINYSMMERTFTGLYTEFAGGVKTMVINSDIRHSLHYIGLPVNVYFNVLSNKSIDFYTFAGGTVEKAVVNNYRISKAPERINYSTSVRGVQLSAAAGFGVEFRLAKYLGIYIDPSLRYYFDCKQPVSIRTQQPLMMSFEIGLRARL